MIIISKKKVDRQLFTKQEKEINITIIYKREKK